MLNVSGAESLAGTVKRQRVINEQNGSIEFESPKIRLWRGMTLQQFSQSPCFSSFKLSQDLEPCFTYRCETAQADSKTFDASVWFYADSISKLSLRIVQPPRPDGEEYFHRHYLRQILGHKPEGDYGTIEYSYDWGRVNAGEVKGCESDIMVIYAS